MRQKAILMAMCLMAAASVSAQYNRLTVSQTESSLEIQQVDYYESSTVVTIKYTRQPGVDWANIGENTYAKTKDGFKKYHMVNSINMPIHTEAEDRNMIFDKPEQVHYFALEFEKLPLGQPFDIIEDETNPSAYNFYDINVDTTSSVEFVNLNDMMLSYPVKERCNYISNDAVVQYVRYNDIVMAIQIQAIKQYGKYFMVNMQLQNMSGKSILFAIENVSAEGFCIDMEKGVVYGTVPLTVLSNSEYDGIVSRRQGWNNFFVALGEGMAAANAGYSSSATSYSSSSHTSGSASAYGYIGNDYFSGSAYGSSYTTTYGRSTTQSYNAGAQYVANQIARNNVNEYVNDQYAIRERINNGYVKNNTIQNQVDYSGFFLIKYNKDIQHMRLNVTIDGEVFPFLL